MNFNVSGLTFHATEGLMDHDFGVGERKAFAFGTTSQKNCPHGGGNAYADSGDGRFDELHGVINSETSGDMSAGRVDIEGDIFFGVFGFQEEHLGDDSVCDGVIYGSAEENDALAEKTGIDVVGAFTT